MKSMLVIDTPETCGDCPLCIFSADEKRYIGYCNTSDEDYYCKALERFMEYDRVEGGIDILGKPNDCPLAVKSKDMTPQNNLAESSQDCISKDEAIRIAEQGQIQGFEWQFKQLCNLSSVTPTTSWISVSTKLPEIHEDVLLSLRSLGVVIGFRAETEPYFYCQGNYIDPQNVLAWMPLPKPYTESEVEE